MIKKFFNWLLSILKSIILKLKGAEEGTKESSTGENLPEGDESMEGLVISDDSGEPDLGEDHDKPVEEVPTFEPFEVKVFTDIHEDTSSLNSLISKLNLTTTDNCLCLGDYIHRNADNTAAKNGVAAIRNLLMNKCGTFISTKGNHDNNTNNGCGYLTDAELFGSSAESYGYKDFPEQGIRLIYINASDYDLFHGDTNGAYMDKYNYDFTWNNVPYITLHQLAAIAEYMRTTPKYYSVLLCGHYPTLGAGTWVTMNRGFSVKPLIPLIRAFINHATATIRYSEYSVTDFSWWSGDTVVDGLPNARIATASNSENTDGGTTLYVSDEIPEEDKRGFIDVDFTENTTNDFIAYFHGHTHNYTCNTAHKIDGDSEPVKDFLEIGFPAVNATRNKGQTDWDTTKCDFYGANGCTDSYGITDNKAVTAGGHASIVNISTKEKKITVTDYSLNGNGFSRIGYYDRENLSLEKEN